jgi:Ca2+-binding EF-hand superfamily protein
MRESLSVLDRDNSGSVDSAAVGLTATPSTLSSYFPSGTQSINLAAYLNTLADLLSDLSHPSELNAAFEAFDDGDDGQIDLADLKDALLHTAPEPGEEKLTERDIDMVVEGFSGRRAFVANVTGGGNTGDNGTGTAAAA